MSVKKKVPVQKVTGLIMFSMGTGMLLVIIIPMWGLILAALMVVFGFWNLFMC